MDEEKIEELAKKMAKAVMFLAAIGFVAGVSFLTYVIVHVVESLGL